jgi:predicted O-methyltransferase YrrM
MAKELPDNGLLVLVDPFFQNLMLERMFGFSMARHIAVAQTRPYREKILFMRKTSVEAAQNFKYAKKSDLIFIDARHDYSSVAEDFRLWSPMLSENGMMAFHDSCISPARPDLDENVGPVRLMREI